MRWLPRLRRGEHHDATPGPGPAQQGAAPAEHTAGQEPAEQRTAGQAGARQAGAAHWRRLPPLAPTVRRAPLTAAATMGVLADELTRPLIHPADSGRRAAARRQDESGLVHGRAVEQGVAVEPFVEPFVGRVTGLVTVPAEPPAEPEIPAPAPVPAIARRRAPASRRQQPEPEPDQAAVPAPSAPHLVPRVLPAAGPRPSLLRAEDEYVGAPEAEAAPYASSAWLRMVQSYRPPWADDPAAAPGAAGGLPMPPLPEGGGSWSSEAAAPPPQAPRAARTDAPKPQRRASLAESRRLGLGKPLRSSPRRGPNPQDSDTPEDSDTPQDSDSPDTQTTAPEVQPEVTQAATQAAAQPEDDAPAEGPAELRHSRPRRADAAPDVAPPEAGTEPEAAPAVPAQPGPDTVAGTGTVADPNTDTDSEPRPRPRPRPRLGLGAPIERPVRPSRSTPPSVPQTPPRAQSTPTRPAPAPAARPAEPAGAASDRAIGDVAEPVRPTPQRRAAPVYRFRTGPAERPASPAEPPHRANPAAGSAPPRTAQAATTPQAAPAGPSTAAVTPASTALPTAPTLPTVPTARLSAPGAPAARPLTHPRSARRSDAARAGAEPQQPAPIPAPQPVPSPAPAQQPPGGQIPAVPAELLDAVRWAHGVDVSDVPIRREPEVADEARGLGAMSFTRGGEVFLPQEQGSPQEPVARGLLAHELTHAAQQRMLGSALPAEDSDAGRALEAQAVAAERWARGLGAPAPAPAAHGGSGAPSAASWSAPWTASGPTAGVQRQSEDVAALPEGDAPAPFAGDADDADPSAQPGAQAPAAGTHVDDELGSAKNRLLELSRQRPLDLDDPGDIEELSARIYQRIHRRLRRDLLLERERAGRLGETGPFGPAR